MKKRAWLCAGVVLALAFTGCHTISYYSQAIHGQFQIINRQRPIQEVLADPQTPATLSNQLALALELRGFAGNELKLKANGHYLNYADLGRRFVVWNVYAAPEFSLQAKMWWYPVVGSLKYQGYFNEAAARRYGTNLAGRGLDVYVGGVTAYSTLGWFRDPVLNTFVFDEETELAETLFHELAHQRVFISGDTDFNEAFATAVGEEGVRRWLRGRSTAAAFTNYEAEVRRKRQFIALLAETHARLKAIYGESDAVDSDSGARERKTVAGEDKMRRLKARVFEELPADYEKLKAGWGGSSEWDGWFSRPINNARLNTVDTYYRFVPAFHGLLTACGGDLEKLYQETQRMGKLGKEERLRVLRGYLAAPELAPRAVAK